MARRNRHEKELEAGVERIHLDVQWPVEVQKLSCLELPAVKKGQTDIYPAWLSLLDQWLSSAKCKVYLVTPFLDVTRMIDICNRVIKWSNTNANIDAIFVREKCFNNDRYNTIVEKAITKICDETTNDCSSLLKKKISNIYHPRYPKNFHAKLIGCIYTDEKIARVLLTSANFTGQSFDFDNLESVSFHEMKEIEFEDRFLTPLRSVQNE